MHIIFRACLLLTLLLVGQRPGLAAPPLAPAASMQEYWLATPTAGAPAGRDNFSYAWAEERQEFYVWGGVNEAAPAAGWVYRMALDRWEALPPPPFAMPADSPSMVWTGAELIIWGGAGTEANRGARYDPARRAWTPINTENGPSARRWQTVVWTGSGASLAGQMIVWGGRSADDSRVLNDGSRYNPLTDRWTPVSDTGAPTPRQMHTAVWSGSEMIVWGGAGFENYPILGDGARYDPEQDRWTAVSNTNAPAARYGHSAVWAGSGMIIYGGYSPVLSGKADGVGYHPGSDTWLKIPEGPLSARYGHSAVWTARSEMIVWGGWSYEAGELQNRNDGAIFYALYDYWATLPPVPAGFTGRRDHAAVWKGTSPLSMLIWGGHGASGPLNSGAMYQRGTNTWKILNTSSLPAVRAGHTAVWTGSGASLAGKLIVWGGKGADGLVLATGEAYDLTRSVWTTISGANAPAPRAYHSVVWTGAEMIVWGGKNSVTLNSGGRYNPGTNSWTPVTTTGAPNPRWGHSAVWTGTEMIIWGGSAAVSENPWQADQRDDGARYNPATGEWSPMAIAEGAPRWRHSAVWTGSEMIVWGGMDKFGSLNTGWRYDPSRDHWTALPVSAEISPRWGHAAAWIPTPAPSGSLIIWGGKNQSLGGGGPLVNDGWRLDLAANTWSPISTAGAPAACGQSFAWTGAELMVWGGSPQQSCAGPTGGAYDPATDSWRALPGSERVFPRSAPTLVWAGAPGWGALVAWGGHGGSDSYPTNTGGVLYHREVVAESYLPVTFSP